MKTWAIWLTFLLCLMVVLTALGWMSFTALDLDRAEVAARREAETEESVRLALWRMDSILAPIMNRESARPYFVYSAFYGLERAYTRMFEELQANEVLVPSPLLTQSFGEILLHFQIAPDGQLSSPQLPRDSMRDLAEKKGFTTPARSRRAAERLETLREWVARDSILRILPSPGTACAPPPEVPANPPPASRGNYYQQGLRNSVEWQARVTACANDLNIQLSEPRPLDVTTGVMTPLWIGDQLLLARRVLVGGLEYVQGCQLDWAAIGEDLERSCADILPDAYLLPATTRDTETPNEGRMLAALPVRLVPGVLSAESFPSPVRLSLIIAWSCVLVAAAAVGLLLMGAISLSERRRRFVSAVTHELRTPLTTFRMYTEMLSTGMIRGKSKREDYLARLRHEADRLGHLVENVLAYARIEGNRRTKFLENVSLRDLVERVRDRLCERSTHAGMEVTVTDLPEDPSVTVRVDVAAVERILFNLVDNACKYAKPADRNRIELRATTDGNRALLRVRDYGPGIAHDQVTALFRPFQKAAHETTSQTPGVGLGLALSRRLAREMGGDLRLDRRFSRGACFLLSLPR